LESEKKETLEQYLESKGLVNDTTVNDVYVENKKYKDFVKHFRFYYLKKKFSYLFNPKRKFPFSCEIVVEDEEEEMVFSLTRNFRFQQLTEQYYQEREKWLDISEMEKCYEDPEKNFMPLITKDYGTNFTFSKKIVKIFFYEKEKK